METAGIGSSAMTAPSVTLFPSFNLKEESAAALIQINGYPVGGPNWVAAGQSLLFALGAGATKTPLCKTSRRNLVHARVERSWLLRAHPMQLREPSPSHDSHRRQNNCGKHDNASVRFGT